MARRSEITRSEIRELVINKCLKLIDQRGENGFKARTIAKEIGYSVGTLYYEFGSMMQLRYHVCSRILDTFLEVLEQEVPPSKRTLSQIMLTYIKLSQSREHLWTFLFTFKAGLREEAPKWYKEKIEQVFSPIEKSLASYNLSRRQSREAAHIIWSSIHGMCVLSLQGKLQMVDADTPDKMATLFLKTYLAGLEKQ